VVAVRMGICLYRNFTQNQRETGAHLKNTDVRMQGITFLTTNTTTAVKMDAASMDVIYNTSHIKYSIPTPVFRDGF